MRLFLLFRLMSRAFLGVRGTWPEFSTPSMVCFPSQFIYQAGRFAAKNKNPFPVRATDGPIRTPGCFPSIFEVPCSKTINFCSANKNHQSQPLLAALPLRCVGETKMHPHMDPQNLRHQLGSIGGSGPNS